MPTEPLPQPHPTPATSDSTPALILDGLTKRFGDKTAVDRLSLHIPSGGVFGFIGPNGAGKTTTFSLICGFSHPDAGSIQLFGQSVSGSAPARGKLGVLPQDAQLPGGDRVGEALTFYARLQGMDRAAARAEAEFWLDALDLPECWKTPCRALSHGMAKRVCIAQALLGRPPLVLLDEPTAGLDAKSASRVRALIQEERKRGTTLLLSSHNLYEMEQLCDAAAILNRGKLVAHGALGALTRSVARIDFQLAKDGLPLPDLRALSLVRDVAFDEARGLLSITYAAELCAPEDVVSDVLRLLLDHGIRIRSIAQEHGLEKRLMELI